VTLTAPLSREAEAIRALRTHVLAQHIEHGRRALAVCAPSADIGCTFVATNLAVALAQVGLTTLLIDADLRSPAIDEIIPPLSPDRGLKSCILNETPLMDEIDYNIMPNLSVLHTGGEALNAQELLSRESFAKIMNECMRDFDVTIVDTPPANTCADGRIVAHALGYAMVVARRNRSLVSDVKTLVRQLEDDHIKVVGTLLNVD
jgi:capsular exopolysaccharide synthesis family protein